MIIGYVKIERREQMKYKLFIGFLILISCGRVIDEKKIDRNVQ